MRLINSAVNEHFAEGIIAEIFKMTNLGENLGLGSEQCWSNEGYTTFKAEFGSAINQYYFSKYFQVKIKCVTGILKINVLGNK